MRILALLLVPLLLDRGSPAATADTAALQPRVRVVEDAPPAKVFSSLSLPYGSPWCNGAPTFWLTGHQWAGTPEAPYCLRNGSAWVRSDRVALDEVDALTTQNNDTSTRIDRHACVALDVNRDGRPDIVCVVGADQGTGAGYNELYLTQPNGTLAKVLQGHGLQKYPSMRTRVAAVLRGPKAAQLLFIGTLGTIRDDGLPNYNVMFRNDYTNAATLPYFHEVVGPFNQYLITVCARAYDLSGNGVDDLIVCNEKGPAELYFQSRQGNWSRRTASQANSTYFYGWLDVRVAEVTRDSRADLIVVSQEQTGQNVLRIFAGVQASPYFNFSRPFFELALPYTAPALEVLDVNRDGLSDLYVVQRDDTTPDTYCALNRNPKPWGDADAPPSYWVPPNDTAPDLLLVGHNSNDSDQNHSSFAVVELRHRLPGCGGPVAQRFGSNRTMILSQGDWGHAGYNAILDWS